MHFGVQLFGLMEQCRRDPAGLFAALGRMGYGMAEPCVAFGPVDGFEKRIWSVEDFAANLPLLRANGLSVPSCHVFAKDFPKAAPVMAAFAEQYGISQLVVNCPAVPDQAACRAFAGDCMTLASGLGRVGAALLLHSNAADSAARLEGLCPYEWILDACEGKVFAQPDVGWLLYGGVDPEAFLGRKGSLVRSLHYKDVGGVAGEADPDTCNVRLGLGLLDTRACYRFAREAGIPQIVDQDVDNGDILLDMAASLALLESFGG